MCMTAGRALRLARTGAPPQPGRTRGVPIQDSKVQDDSNVQIVKGQLGLLTNILGFHCNLAQASIGIVAVNFPNDEIFLTTGEVLEYLQVNLRTVYRLIKAGKIPAVRVGRQWRFRKRDIDTWLDRQRAGAAVNSSAPTMVAEAPRNERQRVLVVDNEASIRDLLSKTLALAEYDVDTASDGNAALDRMRSGDAYDLLIADLKMPGMDGLTLIRQAKRINSELSVIIITGFSTESSAIDAVNLGVTGYLTKPFRVPQVLAAASKALGTVA